ncbi:hypothetical protein VNI00_017166 [Paramarasmius palmivorus]|uniref:Beta-glucuronidase C-terminal domain-containing protein n=1 Tax=Paramarasmius palmivorus TaxID=297713 RepID=A0AAW0B826_9AGAR
MTQRRTQDDINTPTGRPFGPVSVQLSSTAPSGAPLISGSHISLSLELDRWTDWVGLDSRNEFFFNTLDNLAQITGEPPSIRIGANSEDHTNFNGALRGSQTAFPPPTTTVPYPEASEIVVGDTYYQAARFLPPETHVIWGVNFGQNNLTAAVLEAQSIAKAFTSPAVTDEGITLDLVEIGNEADLFRNNGFRSSTYNISQYVKETVIIVVGRVDGQASLATFLWPPVFPRHQKGKFFGGAFADLVFKHQLFTTGNVCKWCILSSEPGSQISTISQHHYSGSFCSGKWWPPAGFDDEIDIRSNLSHIFLILRLLVRGIWTTFWERPIAMRVMWVRYHSTFIKKKLKRIQGAPGVSNVAGAALWTLDYALFARTLNISKVYFHEGIGFKYNLIQPVTLNRSTTDGSDLPAPLPPHVQPQYYAAVIAAEAIGDGGSTKVSEIAVNNSRIAGYAFYEADELARAVFINSEAFLSDSTNRSRVHLDFAFAGTTATTMSVKRLSIGHADDTSGLLWGGQTYETPDGRVSGTLSEEQVSTEAGVDLAETEVILVKFK